MKGPEVDLVGAVPTPSQGGISVIVSSRPQWVDTGVDVTEGSILALSATGTWVDFFIPCSADGYPGRLFYLLGKFPRIQDQGRYFRLMGRIGDTAMPPTTDTPLDPADPNGIFRIGRMATYTPLRSGRLYVFANDGASRYGNNWGHVRLTIRVSPVEATLAP